MADTLNVRGCFCFLFNSCSETSLTHYSTAPLPAGSPYLTRWRLVSAAAMADEYCQTQNRGSRATCHLGITTSKILLRSNRLLDPQKWTLPGTHSTTIARIHRPNRRLLPFY